MPFRYKHKTFILQKTSFALNLSSQTSIKSDPEVPQMRHAPLGRDLVRRSSLSLNDFLDDNIDVQAEKVEMDKSSGCCLRDEKRKESLSTRDFFDDQSRKQTNMKDNVNSEVCLSADEGFHLPTIENLIEKSKSLEESEVSDTSDVLSSTKLGSITSTSIHELPLAPTISTSTLEKKPHSVKIILKKPESLDTSRSLKNLSGFSGQETVATRKHFKSCPNIHLDDSFQPLRSYAESIKIKKRRSLEDPKSLAKIYLNNKICQTDLQKAVNFFRSIEMDDGSQSGQNKHVMITKDKVAALRAYFEGKNPSPPKKLQPTSSFKNSQKSKSAAEAPQTKKLPLNDGQLVKSDISKKLCSIPRLNGFRRITKSAKTSGTTAPPIPTSSSEVPQQPRDVRSASVPSPVLPNKCKESPQFKIAFMKSTSLRSFNHLALNRSVRSDGKNLEANDSERKLRKTLLQKNLPLKSPIIENLDKYKLNLNSHRKNTPTKRSPTLLVDVSEDVSDSYLVNSLQSKLSLICRRYSCFILSFIFTISQSNDETPVDNSTRSANTDPKPIVIPPKTNYKEKAMKREKVPLQTNQAASCQCRTKALANKDQNLSKSKLMQIRTNGSVGPPNVSSKRPTSDKPKLPEAHTSEGIRLVQREDSVTNQTFFCEVPIRRTGSSIPIKTKNSPRSNRPKTALIGHSFSPEKFILRQDQSADHRTPMRRLPSHPMTPHESTQQRSDELPRPLHRLIQDRDGKTSSHKKSSVIRHNKSAELKRLGQVAQDKHWSQCAKTNSNRNIVAGLRSFEAQNNVEHDSETRHDKTSQQKSGKPVRLAKHPSKTQEADCIEERDEFKLISRQLDKLSTSENRQ